MTDQSLKLSRQKTIRRGKPWIVLLGISALIVFQALAYYQRLPLSLGPRVILHPWLLTHGFVSYENIADQHAPLMPLLLSSLVPLFHDGFELARFVLVAMLSLTTLLTFWVGRRLIGWFGGLWAAWFFVVWSPTFGFFKLWYEIFLAPLYLIWLLFYHPSSAPRTVRSSLLLGILGGVSVLFKQHAAVAFIAFVIYNVFTERQNRHPVFSVLRTVGFIGLGAVMPILAYLFYQYHHAGTLEGFFYWTIKYNLAGPYRALATLRPTFRQIGIVLSSLLLMPAAFFCLMDAKHKNDKTWLLFGLLGVMIVAGGINAYPRFNYFHLLPSLPILALASCLTLVYVLRPQNSKRYFPIGIAVALSVYWFVTAGYEYRPVIKSDSHQFVWEYSNLLPLAEKLKPFIGPTQSMYVFPDIEAISNLYYVMRRPPPRFWIFHYPWYLTNGTKTRILTTLEGSPPDWIVLFPDPLEITPLVPEINIYIQYHYRQEASFPWGMDEARLLKRLP